MRALGYVWIWTENFRDFKKCLQPGNEKSLVISDPTVKVKSGMFGYSLFMSYLPLCINVLEAIMVRKMELMMTFKSYIPNALCILAVKATVRIEAFMIFFNIQTYKISNWHKKKETCVCLQREYVLRKTIVCGHAHICVSWSSGHVSCWGVTSIFRFPV